MADFLIVAGLCAAAGALGWLVGRLVRTDGAPRWPLGSESRETYWREALPWPKGVQEDDEIAWHVPREDPEPLPTPIRRRIAGDLPVPPTQPQRRFVER